ncbi:MAG: TIM barrel protein [Streptosporangiales bacterium]|nr:TIM barrel protein [Streptosporangiales bacterium]
MPIRLAAQEHMLEGADLVEKFEFARSVGFDGIELLGKGDGIFAARRDELAAAREAGVVMPSVCVQMDRFIGDFDPDRRAQARAGMKELLSTIAVAGGFGAVTPAAYGLFSRRLPPFTPPRSPEDDRAVLVEELTALGEHAAREGTVVLLEPLNRYEDHMVNTLAKAAELVREVNLPSVRVMADFFHMSIEEGNPAQSLRDVGPLIAHGQLGDTNRLEPGAGHLDWDACLDALADIGYDGWLAMECRLSGPPAEVLPRVAKLLRR